jgi:hypothetical protein
MIRHVLYERLTHKYCDGWAGNDAHRFVAIVKLTPHRMVREYEDVDDGGTYIQHCRAPAGAPNLTRALRDTLSGSNCRHDWDCCGCASRSVRVFKVSARDYVITADISYNY